MSGQEFKIVIDGYVPVPCERPRIGKNGNVYSPTAKHERQLAILMRSSANSQRVPIPFKQDVAVELHVFCQRKRGDIDNQLKTVLDALQKAGIFIDDKQVVESYVRIVKGDEERTSVVVEAVEE